MVYQQLFYSIVALNALFASAAWCAASPNRISIGALLVMAAVWPFTNGLLEGRILLVLSPTHGITVSDLLSVAAVALAIVQVVRRRRMSRASRPDRRP